MRWLTRISNAILRIEKWLLICLAAVLLALILLNIVTRAADRALFWVDELAIYAMVWMALIGASAMVRMRMSVAVTIVTDQLPPRLQAILARVVDALVASLAVTLLVLCWQWYDPVELVRSGFDFDVFAQNTFKFIYGEPTNTIGIRKFWIWLAVPIMSLCMTAHALANLVEGRPPEDSGDTAGKASASGSISA